MRQQKAVEMAAKGVDRRGRQSPAFLSGILESLIDCEAFASPSSSEEGVNKQNENKEVRMV